VSSAIPAGRLGRIARLLSVALRNAWAALAHKVAALVTPRQHREQRLLEQQARSAKRTADAMGAMKGVAMKLGQMISFLDDLMPPVFAEQMRSLQNAAPPELDAETVLAQVELELGRPVEQLFASFDTTAMAAASIGQVHRATTRDGRDVVVKVQYPGVDAAIRADLANAKALAGGVGRFFPTLDARALAEELRERVLEELDYRIEAANQEAFRRQFAGDADLEIPAVVAELSSERVLTTEYKPGLDLYRFCETATEEARQRAGQALHRFVFESIWVYGVFNADPHPGNFLFREDGRVICLDFGCVKQFPDEFLDNMRQLTMAYLDGRRDDFYEQALRMEFIRPGHEHKVPRDWLWDYVRWYHLPILDDAPFTYTPEYTRQATTVMFGDNVRKTNMPPDYLMLNRITFGVNSLLAKLRARHNWHSLLTHYMQPRTRAAS